MDKRRFSWLSKIVFFTFLQFLFVVVWTGGVSAAGSAKNEVVALINKKALTKDDVRHWWENWREKDTPFPDTPDKFIDWFLETNEATDMELYKEPAYQQKVLTFLKVRALMLLKYDEIDSKIKITEKELWDRYIKGYTPLWSAQVLYFKTEDAAKKMCEDLRTGKANIADVVKQLKPGGDIAYQETQLRPNLLPPGWLPVMNGLKVGQVTDPIKISTSFAVLILKDVKNGEKEDFNRFRDRLRKDIWDSYEGKLTNALVERLKKKYHVKITDNLLDAINLENTPAEILDKVLVSTSKGDVTVGVFVDLLKKEHSFRKNNRFQEVNADLLKNMVLNNMIAQTVTSWESLDRKYEEKPPFKWIYQFYCQHRLITELEGRLIESKIKITDEEIEKFYKLNPKEFTTPEVVSFIQIEDDKKNIDKIWMAVMSGEDFGEAAKKLYSKEFTAQSMPLDHLHSPVKEVVAKMASGETSKPFAKEDKSVIIKLVGRQNARLMPLSEVRNNIKMRLEREKFMSLREELLKSLRSKSTITVNQNIWDSLKKEYAHERHAN